MMRKCLLFLAGLFLVAGSLLILFREVPRFLRPSHAVLGKDLKHAVIRQGGILEKLSWSPTGAYAAGLIVTQPGIRHLTVIDQYGRVLVDPFKKKMPIAEQGYMVRDMTWQGNELFIVTQFAPAAYVESKPSWHWTPRDGLKRIES